MRTSKETVASFRDISKSEFQAWRLKFVEHHDYKLILTLRSPGRTESHDSAYTIFYADNEVCLDDYRKLLRLFKKLNGK